MSASHQEEFQKSLCPCNAFAEPDQSICNKTRANPSTIKVLRQSVNAVTDSRNVPLSKAGWRSWFGFKFRREQCKQDDRKHLDEMRYHRGKENHHSKSYKQQLTKQPQNHSVNTAIKTETKIGRHKKTGRQGKHHTVCATQNYLIFPCYLDSLSFLSSHSSLVSSMTYLPATHPGKNPIA